MKTRAEPITEPPMDSDITPHTNVDLDVVLSDRFGHEKFRSGQREVVEILLEGRSALAVFPTGAGKSLCYQLPAVLLNGLTLVISPLIALMKDQVEAMVSQGVKAARLDSSLEADEVRAIYGQMNRGELKLLYVAPERLANEGFLGKLRRTDIRLIAIDEAHCISEWGHNFRPDYLKLGNLIRELGVERVLALTATATPPVAEDIRENLGIRSEDHIQTGFRRRNLLFHVTPCVAADRADLLLAKLKERPPGPAIVYVTLQKTSVEIAAFLTDHGLKARAYHAGMRSEDRVEVQDEFMSGASDIVVATIAFGMGIDKADIRYVYHYNLPKSLEAYVQESGRAGRDGEDAICEILACGDDLVVLENFVYGDTPSAAALKTFTEHILLSGEEFAVSRYELSGTMDIRPLVVATALAYLELKGILESQGPFYSSYHIRFLRPMENVLAGYNPGRQEFLKRIFAAAKTGRTWKTLDVTTVANATGESEGRIRRALNYLADTGDLVAKPSGLMHGYRKIPGHPGDLKSITNDLTELFHKRERGEIARLGRVTAYCQSMECHTQEILAYFGETMNGKCGSCGNCQKEHKGESRELPRTLDADLTADQVATIREVMEERHSALRQPRQLARFFCGISSPAATRQKLKRHPLFGSLEDVPFMDVLCQTETML